MCAGLVGILCASNIWFFLGVTKLQGQVVNLQDKLEQLQSNYVTTTDRYMKLNLTFNELASELEELGLNYMNITEDYISLNEHHTVLLNDFNQLAEEYEELTDDFEELGQNFTTLSNIHQTLQEQYSTLNTLYQQLQTSYQTLNNTYNIHMEQYEVLLELWNEPLEYYVTPTWDEVIEWLATDGTDNKTYDKDKFLCGDFSMMLIQHAKEMHWRMLFTVLEFDYYYENPKGTKDHHGYNAHAFVSVFTTEGIVYIEPQTDYTWYLYDFGDPETHVEFTDWEFIDFGDDWFGHIFVQYYNRMATDSDLIENRSASIEVAVP